MVRHLLCVLVFWCFGVFVYSDGASRVNEVLVKLKEPKKGKSLETYILTEQEVNSFADAAIQSKKRLGIMKVSFDLKPGTFFTTALINMDDVKLSGFAFRMFKAVLSGTQRLEAEGKLLNTGGKGSYEVQSARFNNIPVPAFVVNAVIGYLGQRQPPHIDVTEPFTWPYGIRDVKIVTDKVVVIR